VTGGDAQQDHRGGWRLERKKGGVGTHPKKGNKVKGKKNCVGNPSKEGGGGKKMGGDKKGEPC